MVFMERSRRVKLIFFYYASELWVFGALPVIRQFCFVLYICFEVVEGEVVNNFVVDMWITF